MVLEAWNVFSSGLLSNRLLRGIREFSRRASTCSQSCRQFPTLKMRERGSVLDSAESSLNRFSRGVGGSVEVLVASNSMYCQEGCRLSVMSNYCSGGNPLGEESEGAGI